MPDHDLNRACLLPGAHGAGGDTSGGDGERESDESEGVALHVWASFH